MASPLDSTAEAEPLKLAAASNDIPSAPVKLCDDPEMTRIYNEHSKPVFYLALRFLGDAAQAEDATHDVFLKAYRKLGDFRGQSSLRTWLYRITVNHCQNLLQSWHHRKIQNAVDDVVWETAPSGDESPLRLLETKELGERIQNTLNAMSEEYRLILLLVADENLSYEAVAEVTGQSVDAVRGKLHRARKAFAASFRQSAGHSKTQTVPHRIA